MQSLFNAMQKAKVFSDKDLRVRLAAVLATTDMKASPAIGNVLVDMAENEENIKDTWLKHALIIAGKLNEETFRAAFRKRGLNANPSLTEASVAQRLTFGSRLTELPLRRSFGRQQQNAAPAPEVVSKEILISGDLERGTNRNPAAPASGRPLPYSGVVMVQGNKANGYGVYHAWKIKCISR